MMTEPSTSPELFLRSKYKHLLQVEYVALPGVVCMSEAVWLCLPGGYSNYRCSCERGTLNNFLSPNSASCSILLIPLLFISRLSPLISYSISNLLN